MSIVEATASPTPITRFTMIHRFAACLIWLSVCFPPLADAHEGRRFEVIVRNDNTLWAQGSIGGGVDDGGGLVRPYLNSIHDHWVNAPGLKEEAIATLPAWDIIDPHPSLLGHSLTAELVDAYKWVAPPLMPPAGTIPYFQPLAPHERVEITNFVDTIDTDSFGSIELVNMVDVHGHFDLPIEYKINKKPLNEIFVFEWIPGSGAPDINDSFSIFAVLSPDGTTPAERLHHASLYTERFLGAPIPEPTGIAIVLPGADGLAARRRRI